jgi:hypothetical protein
MWGSLKSWGAANINALILSLKIVFRAVVILNIGKMPVNKRNYNIFIR